MNACDHSDSVPTVIWWQIGTRQPSFTNEQKVINDYVYSRLGFKVEFRVAGWGEGIQRFNTLINTGEYFDILFTDVNTYNRFVTIGAFADITDMVPEVTPNLWETVPYTLWDGVKIGGRIFSVPSYKDSSVTGYYFWDSDLVEKYGIDLERTGLAFLDETFRKIKAGEGPRFYPFNLSRSSNQWIFDYYDNMLSSFPPMGVRIDDETRRVVLTLEQPDILETLGYFRRWFQDGIINPDANLINETPTGSKFLMNQAWPSVAPLYASLHGIKKFEPVRFYGPYYSTASIQGSMNAISTNSRYKKESLRLLELVNTDTKLRDMLAYGIEGQHFEYVEIEGRGTAVRQIIPEWSLTNYQQGNYFIITPQENVPATYWDEVRHQNETAIQSTMMGFMLNIDPVLVDLTNLRIIWERHAVDIVAGAADLNVALPRVISELRAAGLDRVMAEAQRQVDEFFGMQR